MRLPLPRWFAHRGGGTLAPENTLAGIRLAARLGYRAVEFDVMLSADRTPVLIHDETLERTTNGAGRVCETTDEALFALDAGGGEAIPRLREALVLCRELGLLANVEIKPAPRQDEATARLAVGEIVAGGHGGGVLISSFSLTALEVARDLAPAVLRGVLFETPPPDWPAIVHRLRAASLHCAAAAVSDALLDEAGARGVPVLCYTVNAPALAGALFARGVSAMFTDALEVFAAESGVSQFLPSA